jgi:hypothetical protein
VERWLVKGKYERHRRTFEVDAVSAAEAQYEAEVMIRSVYSKSTGVYTRLVWQFGSIHMKNIETGQVLEVAACPPDVDEFLAQFQ